MAQEFTDRRQFLKTTGAGAITTSLFPRKIRGANDRVNVAFIGMGRMGSGNLGYAARVPGFQIVAVCDVYQPALESARAQARTLGCEGVKAVKDFREILADKSVDAVSIATPDHWHAYLTVEACKNHKDVWVEEPACVYVDEGPKMVEAARKYRRIVQAGTMQRSGGFFQKAREIVKSGDLGDIRFCRGLAGESACPPRRCAQAYRPAGELGYAAPSAPMSGGAASTSACATLPGFGNHLLDIVQFAFDEAMPVSVSAQGGKFYVTDKTESPDTMMVTYRYPGFIVSYESRPANTDGISFHGTRATLMVNRNGYTMFPNGNHGAPLVEKRKEMAEMNVPHWKNFLECVRSRQKPVSDIETCVRSTTTCILANLSLRHGVTLDWDDQAFTVKQDEVKPRLKARYRSPWKLEV